MMKVGFFFSLFLNVLCDCVDLTMGLSLDLLLEEMLCISYTLYSTVENIAHV